jgi:hypothetical protein
MGDCLFRCCAAATPGHEKLPSPDITCENYYISQMKKHFEKIVPRAVAA